MARIIPLEDAPRFGSAGAQRGLAEQLARALGDDWTILPDRTVESGGESGRIDFILIGATTGVALVGLVDDAAEASPQEAAVAFRGMLEAEGFFRRFKGELPIAALAIESGGTLTLAARIQAAFAGKPPLTLHGGEWAAWIRERLSGGGAAGSAGAAASLGTPLRGPSRDEAWRVAPAREKASREEAMPPPRLGVAVAPDDHVEVVAPRAGRTLWAAMAFAICITLAVLAGMAVLSHGNGPRSGQISSTSPR